MKYFPLSGRVSLSAAIALAIVTNVHPNLNAQVTLTHGPQLGASNPVTAEPTISRLSSPHCTVNLFKNMEFANYNPKNFTYNPPSGCPGPYAKIIFAADFTVTQGRQFDRTAQFYIGGANVFFGTTAEPRKTISPSWHVENDVTHLGTIFDKSQPGSAILGNFVGVYGGVSYTGLIYSSAHLVFYPVTYQDAPAKVPDVVIGIPGNSGAGTLNTSKDVLTQTVTLPINTEAAYLDVIAQSQSNDEFWYLCVPDSVAGALESCGGTGFRETEISVDGKPAGIAPIYPWVFTGGIDPYLWAPIPGVQTLNFKPFRVDLTPFAGELANGKPHTIGIRVFNANGYFSVTGNLLVYTDKGSSRTSGYVIKNTLSTDPHESIDNKIVSDANGDSSGSVAVSSKRDFEIIGKVKTSHGEVTTKINGLLEFSNKQTFIINEIEYKQLLNQATEGGIYSYTTENGVTKIGGQAIYYPFTFDYDQLQNEDGTYTVHNISNQRSVAANTPFGPGEGVLESDPFANGVPFIEGSANQVSSSDDMHYDVNGVYTYHSGSSSQGYVQGNSAGDCYSRELVTKGSVLTGRTDGAVCERMEGMKFMDELKMLKKSLNM